MSFPPLSPQILIVFWYLFCGWFTSNLSLCYVILSLLVAIDFYVTKNISGRFLVGLRWWTTTDANGNIAWKYETKDVHSPSSLKSR